MVQYLLLVLLGSLTPLSHSAGENPVLPSVCAQETDCNGTTNMTAEMACQGLGPFYVEARGKAQWMILVQNDSCSSYQWKRVQHIHQQHVQSRHMYITTRHPYQLYKH